MAFVKRKPFKIKNELTNFLALRSFVKRAPADALAVVRHTGVYVLDFFCNGIWFYVLLSPYLCFISFLYLDIYMYVLGDDAWISYGSFMQTNHLCVLIHI